MYRDMTLRQALKPRHAIIANLRSSHKP